MISDFERIKALIARAESEVLLCSPFIKEDVLALILQSAPENVPVRIITRWRPNEIAVGVSDLEVFNIANARPRTNIYLLDSIHAKLYLADDKCLIGSANLTAMALGLRMNSNIEILIDLPKSDSNVAVLLDRLLDSKQVTEQIYLSMKDKVAGISHYDLDEGKLEEGNPVDKENPVNSPNLWLPKCSMPSKLYSIYENSNVSDIIDDTRLDGLGDIECLRPPDQLSKPDFMKFIAGALVQFPSIMMIIDRIPSQLTDEDGMSIIREIAPDLDQDSIRKQWEIVRDWIIYFFNDKYEMSPHTFILHLKRAR